MQQAATRTPLAGFKLARSLLKGVRRSAGDDSNVTGPATVTVVPMQGRDFTGLGFTITGNMRDGIFVKDVLPRGPAGESGSIKSGGLDFGTTFLLWGFKSACTCAGDKLLSLTVSLAHVVLEDALNMLSYASPYELQIEVESTPGAKKAVKSPSPQDPRLCHPLYRSQSSGDLDGLRNSGKTATPKQSPMLAPAPLVKSTSKKSDRSKGSHENTPPSSLSRTPKKGMDIPDVVLSAPASESPEPEPPQVTPRTKGTPGKRRAPAPPPQVCPQETTVLIHQEEDTASQLDIDMDSLEDISKEPPPSTQVPGGKRSASLGDLDNLDQKTPSLLFERAISLDLPTHLEEDKETLPPERLTNGEETHLPLDHSPRIKKWIVKENLTASTESNDSNNNSVPSSGDMVEVSLEDDPTPIPAEPAPKTEEQVAPKCPEVIEITEGELDDVMMSHKQYLMKQGRSMAPAGTKKEEDLGFEPWSYKEENKSQKAAAEQAAVEVTDAK
ncbi:hypothetical protein LAZ67_16001404 [Cordylochernes scorpioides]|uniref:PDZ domain-containing protein n=1 Tax=Cordylochernes scorpioides TaxID=51811 RepID=A0ABY6LC78_9ARAC|nr:hypothetical protein LAZ67_16001404 [Cordylochernes scorpioides]